MKMCLSFQPVIPPDPTFTSSRMGISWLREAIFCVNFAVNIDWNVYPKFTALPTGRFKCFLGFLFKQCNLFDSFHYLLGFKSLHIES